MSVEDNRNVGAAWAGEAFKIWCDAKKSGMSEEALDGLLVGIHSFVSKLYNEPVALTQYEIDLDAFMEIYESYQVAKEAL